MSYTRSHASRVLRMLEGVSRKASRKSRLDPDNEPCNVGDLVPIPSDDNVMRYALRLGNEEPRGVITLRNQSTMGLELLVEYKGKKCLISYPASETPIRYVTKGQVKQIAEFIDSLD